VLYHSRQANDLKALSYSAKHDFVVGDHRPVTATFAIPAEEVEEVDGQKEEDVTFVTPNWQAGSATREIDYVVREVEKTGQWDWIGIYKVRDKHYDFLASFSFSRRAP